MDKCVCGAKTEKIKTTLELFDGNLIIKNVDALYCHNCKEELLTAEHIANPQKRYNKIRQPGTG